ncbi:hypothetical protein [Variovorax sp. 770b2]|uniref:hypothetical protein n=1 Tax=Variovorax sp. 770b2 TaxID=1566271 RepID=UPI0008EE1A04|nr:hypothetical protein [Variovorax sp. 770b2]SFQ17578.1 hypothetical protein SAMN03159339_5881 [Variovorax sp. 770b2]
MNSNPGRKVHFLSLSTTARRILLALSCAALGLMQWGCASTPEGEPVHGKDQVVSFLAAKDGRKVVIAAENYHYVFDGDPSVAALLRWSGRAKVTPSLNGELKVARDQSFEGSYVLMAFDADLAPEDRAFLIQTGFAKTEVKYGDRTGPALRYFGTVYGTRYAAAPLKPADTLDFSRANHVNYVEQETATGPAAKPARTPLIYDDDGKLLVGGVPMFIVQGGTDYRCRARFMDICFYK